MLQKALLLASVGSACGALVPPAYKPLPVGSVTPKGWLLKQLTLQAEGLSGHLAQFWTDIMDSIWIGGSGDGGLHERTPYWLNGMVPLAFLLKNAGIEELPPVVGIYKAPWGKTGWMSSLCKDGVDMPGEDLAGGNGYLVASPEACRDDCTAHGNCYGFVIANCTSPPRCWLKGGNGPTIKDACRCYGKNIPKPTPVNVMKQVESYVSYILDNQQGADGWLGPALRGGGDYWGPSNVLQTLWQWAEALQPTDPAAAANATVAVLRHLLAQHELMLTNPLASWAKSRWIDMAHTAEWLLDKAELKPSEAETLLSLIGLLKQQGEDWDGWFEAIPAASNHNVNIAQGLKSAAVYSRYNDSATYLGHSMAELSARRMAHLDATYGQPTGMYLGDEITPVPVTRSPSRGIELCGVVEAMYSYEIMFSIHGDLRFAERTEQIAYNALPATWASPTGGDMWAHQYLQAVNEINAIRADPHVWQHDNDMSETYGLEPNYGCCTANFHQGWPKFANSLFFTAADGGVVVAIYAPASATLPGGGLIDVETSYPFGDKASVTVRAAAGTSVYLRIPSWATAATVNGAAAANGTLWRGSVQGSVRGLPRSAASEATSASFTEAVFNIDFAPAVRLMEWDAGAVSVHRGALLYSLPIASNYTVYAHHFGTDQMSSDYYLTPTSAWQFALDVNPAALDPASLVFKAVGYHSGSAAWNHSNWPVTIAASLRPLPSWNVTLNSAAEPPESPACARDAPTPLVAAAPGVASAAGQSACGPAEVHALVPHGGTELRIGEWPVAFYGPSGQAKVTQR